jgi:hypothetical protein
MLGILVGLGTFGVLMGIASMMGAFVVDSERLMGWGAIAFVVSMIFLFSVWVGYMVGAG